MRGRVNIVQLRREAGLTTFSTRVVGYCWTYMALREDLSRT